jgi:hypothetical protein
MKRFFTLLAMALCGLTAWAATITNTIVDPSGSAVSGLAVKFSLLSSPYGDTNLFVVAKPVTATTGTNGTITNVLRQGLYQVDFGNYYGSIRILVPNDSGWYDMMTIATNLPTWQVTNYMQVFAGATLLTDLGTAYYSNATAFLMSYQTNQPASQITNAGTAIYSNATSFLLAWQTNQPLAQITNAGTIAYSNAANYTVSTLAGVVAAMGYTPATNTYAGISNAVGFKLATNSYAGINSAVGFTVATNREASAATYGLFTNGNLIWLSTNLADAVEPNAVLPNGSILTTTNGAFYIRTNGAWLQK